MPKLEHGKPTCPTCGKRLDGFTEVSRPGSAPKAGDVGVCLYCLTPLEYCVDVNGLNVKTLDDINTLTSETRNELKLAMDNLRIAKSIDRRRN